MIALVIKYARLTLNKIPRIFLTKLRQLEKLFEDIQDLKYANFPSRQSNIINYVN